MKRQHRAKAHHQRASAEQAQHAGTHAAPGLQRLLCRARAEAGAAVQQNLTRLLLCGLTCICSGTYPYNDSRRADMLDGS